MKINKTHLFVFALLSLSGCSTVSDIFVSKDDTPPLEGERISVLELQRALVVDAPQSEEQKLALPQLWQNPAWPQAGGFPNHAMQNLSFSQEAPQKLWSTSAGRGSRSDLPLNAQPIVAEDKVFTLDTKATLYAFDAQSGKKLWSQDVGSEEEKEDVITGGAAYAHGTVFVTNGYDEALAVSPRRTAPFYGARPYQPPPAQRRQYCRAAFTLPPSTAA